MWQYWSVIGNILVGTARTVLRKFMMKTSAVGDSKLPAHKFEKPWWLTLSVVLGEMFGLPIYYIQRWYKLKKGEETVDKEWPSFATYCRLIIPAFCDTICEVLMSIAQLFLNASALRILEGSVILFNVLYQQLFLKRPALMAAEWLGLSMSFVGLAVVSLASILPGVEQAGGEKIVIGVFIALMGQAVNAGQNVLEDFFIHDVSISPVFVLGAEGLWGTLMVCFIGLPIAQHLGGKEGNGLREDTLDTLACMGNSSTILVSWLAMVVLGFGVNFCGLYFIELMSALAKTVLGQVKSIMTWIIQLILFYSLNGVAYGEEWTKWSWVQLIGFFLVFGGSVVYSALVKLPCLTYRVEVADDEEAKEVVVSDEESGKKADEDVPVEPLTDPVEPDS